jgi:hypothetical protein
MDTEIAYKVLTHDLRPPIQGGEPVFDGVFPHVLPTVACNTDPAVECGAGWNACAKLSDALRIAGLWPNGRSSRVVLCEAPAASVVRAFDKVRAPTWTLSRELSEDEIADGVREFSVGFGEHADVMTAEQMAWRQALARPKRDRDAVIAGLRAALDARGLIDWELQEYPSSDCTPRAAWYVWVAWRPRVVWVYWAVWYAGDTWDARDALVHRYAAHKGWVDAPADQYTVGIRDAYEHGLGIVVPVGPGKLGWTMDVTESGGSRDV